MKPPLRATTLAIASALAFVASAADDALLVTTISPPTGTTDCTKNNFGYSLNDRAAIVRGGPNHKIRIEKTASISVLNARPSPVAAPIVTPESRAKATSIPAPMDA